MSFRPALAASLLVLACSSAKAPPPSAEPHEAGAAGAAGEPGAAGSGGAAGEAPDAEAPDALHGEDAGSAGEPGSSFFGASRCASAGVELCDGFESGKIDSSIWTVLAPPGNDVRVDDTRSARGSFALHVTASNEASTRASISQKQTFPATKNSFYGRAFVYLAAVPINNFNLFAAKGAGGDFNLGGQVKPLGDPNGTSMIRFSTHPLHTSSLSQTPVPSGSWDCWEWYFDGDGESELRAWLNEIPLDEMTVVGGTSKGTWVAPEFESLSFGFHHPHPEPEPSYEVWLDEIAVDSQRIGCVR